jgi:hypothetical protein
MVARVWMVPRDFLKGLKTSFSLPEGLQFNDTACGLYRYKYDEWDCANV